MSETIIPYWDGTAIVVATGPSLTQEQVDSCRGFHTVAVSDAYILMPWADVLYSCDAKWWKTHKGCPDFHGDKWTSHHQGRSEQLEVAKLYGLKVIEGDRKDGFSLDPSIIHYGKNSGYQAVNLAILFGAKRILLIGFDMRSVGGLRHFFGDHPKLLNQRNNFVSWITMFNYAADMLPSSIQIINCTPDSALKCFPMMPLEQALKEDT